jgi:hypothetical protein
MSVQGQFAARRAVRPARGIRPRTPAPEWRATWPAMRAGQPLAMRCRAPSMGWKPVPPGRPVRHVVGRSGRRREQKGDCRRVHRADQPRRASTAHPRHAGTRRLNGRGRSGDRSGHGSSGLRRRQRRRRPATADVCSDQVTFSRCGTALASHPRDRELCRASWQSFVALRRHARRDKSVRPRRLAEQSPDAPRAGPADTSSASQS